MLVHPRERRRGVGRALLAGAVTAARERGAVAVEALPRGGAGPFRDDEVWLGPRALFDELGFVAIGGPDPYPVLRLELVR
jgi:GNAT superfamily N-acetyltransferase